MSYFSQDAQAIFSALSFSWLNKNSRRIMKATLVMFLLAMISVGSLSIGQTESRKHGKEISHLRKVRIIRTVV
ncbi:MAG: hypothetical protein L0Y35_07500 [Flammeovirgaceae bacterium]|nr:hypothetical protein [Flammeovirgaceae bacterium]